MTGQLLADGINADTVVREAPQVTAPATDPAAPPVVVADPPTGDPQTPGGGQPTVEQGTVTEPSTEPAVPAGEPIAPATEPAPAEQLVVGDYSVDQVKTYVEEMLTAAREAGASDDPSVLAELQRLHADETSQAGRVTLLPYLQDRINEHPLTQAPVAEGEQAAPTDTSTAPDQAEATEPAGDGAGDTTTSKEPTS